MSCESVAIQRDLSFRASPKSEFARFSSEYFPTAVSLVGAAAEEKAEEEDEEMADESEEMAEEPPAVLALSNSQ